MDDREPPALARVPDLPSPLGSPAADAGALVAILTWLAALLAYNAGYGLALVLFILLGGLGAALGAAAVVGRRAERSDRQGRGLAACASRLGLELDPHGSFSGDFGGVPVDVRVAGPVTEVRARFRQPGPAPVGIGPRGRIFDGRPLGSPVLDLVAALEPESASPALIARLIDPANAEVALRVLHGYPDWSIHGVEEVAITVYFRDAADEYTLENALRAVVALARVLAGEGGGDGG